ncbi:MAG: GrdX family protein [Lachnospiraceae bacterium]|nr:GrdX family protein [Lachnospiraceae bacterium]
MKYIIITNNPLVRDTYKDKEVEFYDIKYQEILQTVKNKIALGHKILTHPLSGSVKPKETPYKSIMISKETVGANATEVDLESLEIIEDAIATCEKFKERSDKWTPQVLKDFQLVDFTLIDSAIDSAKV